MQNENFSITGGLRDDRVDGKFRKRGQRHEDVPRTNYLDVANLIIDESDGSNPKEGHL